MGHRDPRRRNQRVQQARRRPARVRGQGVAAGQRVLQVPHHRHRRRLRQLAARAVVRRPRHHRRLRAARQLPLPLPRRHDRALAAAAHAPAVTREHASYTMYLVVFIIIANKIYILSLSFYTQIHSIIPLKYKLSIF